MCVDVKAAEQLAVLLSKYKLLIAALPCEWRIYRPVQAEQPPRAGCCILQIVFPGRMMLADVVVSHSLTLDNVAQDRNAPTRQQQRKKKKYADVAARLGAELLNLSVDTCGGMASEAVRLVKAIGEEGERWTAGTWSSSRIERMLLGSIAVSVQRGNALAMLSGFTRSAGARAGVLGQGWAQRRAELAVDRGGD